MHLSMSQEMFLAGTETTSTTVEWAMTELLLNPESITKVKDEIAKVVGPSGKLEEKDTDNLHYLHAVVKEALRLHAPFPFLVPRRSSQDTNFMGYHIPKNTQVLVNAWAIGRDPEYWDESLSFKPERFLGSNLDYKGKHYELIPFGAGRRICIGIPLAQRMVMLILASLLHEFDWVLDNNMTSETIDMKEKLGITARKLEPLKATPKRAKMLKL